MSYHTSWRQARIAAGLCPRCAEPVVGTVYCGACLEKNRIRTRAWRRANKDAGLCHCGKARAADKQSCENCIELAKKEQQKKKNARICVLCSKKHDGNAYRCNKCLARCREQTNEYVRLYSRHRRRTDIQYKISCYLRTRLWVALNGGCKVGSAVEALGCSLVELVAYLTKLFQPGMSWDNYGEWHIDHIKPLSSFDLTDKDQFCCACHHTNLQPLWAEDNLRKSNKEVDV